MINNFSAIELFVVLKDGKKEQHYNIPTTKDVKILLVRSLETTRKKLRIDDGDWETYEFAEEYAPKERLRLNTNSSELTSLVKIQDLNNINTDSSALDSPENITYYYVKFTKKNNQALFTFKRAQTFKPVLEKNGNFLSPQNGMLDIFTQNVFKLADDFDFIANDQYAYILHPVGFKNILKLNQYILEKAKEKTLALQKKLPFIDFEHLSHTVENNIGSANVIASLSAYSEIENLAKSKILAKAKEARIKINIVSEKLRPEKGSEVDFLKILNFQIYTVQLTEDGEVLVFEALRKKQKKSMNKP